MMKAHTLEPEEAKKLNADWIFELKIDGAREFWDGENLISTRDVNHNERYSQIYTAVKDIDAILDGEVALIGSNVLELNKKENWKKAKFYVFDLLKYEGKDTRKLPLKERQNLLKMIVKMIDSPAVQFIPQFKSFKEGWDYILKNDLEGVMAKKLDSKYGTGIGGELRSFEWRKIKYWKEGREEIVAHEERTTEKGCFVMANGSKINCPDMETLKEYEKAKKQHKKVFGEFYYRFLSSKNNYYTPILKRLDVV